jgi:HPt (histidine-containing phosphotransfer) domain-containing protein
VAYIDLNYLKSMTGGDEEIMKEMIDLFILQVPEFIENLNRYLKNKDYSELGKEAHKAKSSVTIMGMNELGKDLKTLQLLTISGKEKETYPDYIKKFETQCLEAVNELKNMEQ